jgi:hypothetical protein
MRTVANTLKKIQRSENSREASLHTVVVVVVKVKVKFTIEQAMKAQKGSRGIALLLL